MKRVPSRPLSLRSGQRLRPHHRKKAHQHQRVQESKSRRRSRLSRPALLHRRAPPNRAIAVVNRTAKQPSKRTTTFAPLITPTRSRGVPNSPTPPLTGLAPFPTTYRTRQPDERERANRAKRCVWKHSGSDLSLKEGHGENLAAVGAPMSSDDQGADSVKAAIKMWTDEEKYTSPARSLAMALIRAGDHRMYNYDKPGFSMDTGHLTQSVSLHAV